MFGETAQLADDACEGIHRYALELVLHLLVESPAADEDGFELSLDERHPAMQKSSVVTEIVKDEIPVCLTRVTCKFFMEDKVLICLTRVMCKFL